MGLFIVGSYADLHISRPCMGSHPVQRTADTRRPTVEHMGLALIIHEQFYCKRGYAATTGVLAPQSVNVPQRVRLPPSQLR